MTQYLKQIEWQDKENLTCPKDAGLVKKYEKLI
jgi:hypothetical protein